jgi:CBS domain-containing protein
MKTKDIEIPPVDSVMKRRVEAFSADTEITAAVDVLLRRCYSGAPVVDADGRVIGIISEHDCLRVLSQALYEDWPTGTVADHMTRKVYTVEAGTDLVTVAHTFANHTLRRVPVVDAEGKLVGLVTRRDLMRGLEQLVIARGKLHKATAYELIEARNQAE